MITKEDVMKKQVGGNHYKKKIQPWDIVDTYELNFYEGGALKYILRRKDPMKRIEDLEKAIHYLEKEIINVRGRNECRS